MKRRPKLNLIKQLGKGERGGGGGGGGTETKTVCQTVSNEVKYKQENEFMKHYAPNHMLAPKKGSSQKGVQLKP